MHYFGFNELISLFKWMVTNEIASFEKKIATFIGVKYAIGTSYGRTALYLGLKAIGVEGKEVILPTFTCTVVRQAIELSGARPLFVDIDYETLNFDTEALKNSITENTKVVLITHYFGGIADNMEEIIEICKNNNIFVVEDCAHSMGAEYKNRKVGSYGDFSIFSLTKGMINFGGGILATDNTDIYQKAQIILTENKMGLIKRIVDFPLILSYGLGQAIDKLLLDRIIRGNIKYFIAKIPSYIDRIRNKMIIFVKMCIPLFRPHRRSNQVYINGNEDMEKKHNHRGIAQLNPYPLEMRRIIASVGQCQLKRLNKLIESRKIVYNAITGGVRNAMSQKNSPQQKEVYTNLVFRLSKRNIYHVIDECNEKGIFLRRTWPAHQKLWKNQNTETVLKFRDNVLIYNISPALTVKEIEKIRDFINDKNTIQG